MCQTLWKSQMLQKQSRAYFFKLLKADQKAYRLTSYTIALYGIHAAYLTEVDFQ